jgi:hypothetical protein
MRPRRRERDVRVAIAGRVFRVVGLDRAARAWLRERYAPFLARGRADLTLAAAAAGRWPRGRAPRPRVEWRRGRFRVVMATCRVEGDLGARRARLVVPPVPSALGPSVFRALCSLVLLRERGFLLHAAAVAEGRRGWVFCGPSESGKTTLARLAAPRAVLNDETVAIVPSGRGYAVAATPFFGEGGPVMARRNRRVALRAVFFLHPAPALAHRRLTPGEAAARAWGQVFLPKRDRAVAEAALESVARFSRRVPCFDLWFPPTRDVWEYVDRIA